MSCTRLVPPAALALVACAACCVAAEPAAPAKPTKEQIAKWVQQLGSDDFGTREEASKKLYEAGQSAEAALQEALKNDDAEIVRRAGEILDKFKWGLYPDAPQKVVDLVRRYQAADLAGRQAVIKELLEAGPAGYRTLLKIAEAEPDQNVRRTVVVQIIKELGRAAPQMVVEENYATLEQLLEIVLAEDVKQGVGHYAAYWMMRGKLDDRIAHFKGLAAAKGPDAKQASLVLAHLYRAKGDLAAARDAAEKADDPVLVDALLYEAGDWKELARRPVNTESGQPYEKIGHQAAYHRLAGDTKAFEDDLAELRKLADAAPGDDSLHFYFAKVLFLNDRPADAVDALVKGPGHHAVAFEILAAQMKYRAALELADKDDPADLNHAPVLAVLKARTLYSLGEKEKALAIFAKYGDQIKEGADFAWFENLIEAELRVGLKDLAEQHAAKVFTVSRDQGWGERLLPKLFPDRSEAAKPLWDIIHLNINAPPPPDSLKKIRDWLGGKGEVPEIEGLVKDVEASEKTLDAKTRDLWWRAVAEVALASKKEDLARSILEKAGTAGALIRFGDLHADKKEWEKASDRYQQAWDKDHGQPLALYLSGWALAKAGKDKEGQKRMDQSHWTPLGDEVLRFGFLRALAERGHKDAARREGELLLRFSQPGFFYSGEGMRRLALADMDRKEYLKAADGQERSMLRCLRTYINYVQPTAYVGVPALLHRLRANGDVAAGKLDDAQREIAAGLADLPGDVNIPIRLIPELEKAGRKKEAGQLFDQCLAAQDQLCKDYPNCSWGHNSVAWLSVCCRRNLDKALDHALKAVELSPASSGYQDTLAEVYFQRGDKDKAIAAQKKAIELEPKKAYFRKQLKRIEAGDPAVERPSEEEDDD